MNLKLRYGVDGVLSLQLADEQLVTHCASPRGEPLADVAEAVDRALAEPMEFPPLARAVLPGDKVALVLTDTVPAGEAVVAGAVRDLVAAGVQPSDITLVSASSDSATPSLWDELSCELQFVHQVHDPSDRGALGYVAASKSGDPIYINRVIHEADLVITVGCLRLDTSLGIRGAHAGMFPAFSDTSSQNLYRSLKSAEPRERERLQHAAEEAGWLVGSPYTIQVVPGADDTALHVLAGDPRAVFYRGGQLCTEAWRSAIPRRAELVIATVTGHGQQTWESVARALAVAANAVEEDGGALAVCCQLSDEPGAALQRLAGADDPSAALRRIGKRKPADTLVAAEIAQMLERGKFYLVSQLEDELVESLGILPIAASQLSRLAERYESCLVLENAQYAVAASSDEPSAPSGAIQSRSAS